MNYLFGQDGGVHETVGVTPHQKKNRKEEGKSGRRMTSGIA